MDPDGNQLKKFVKHITLLMQKIVIMFARNKKGVEVQILCPILFCFIIYIFSNLEPVLERLMRKFGWTHEIYPVNKCWGTNCVSIGYSIIGDPQE